MRPDDPDSAPTRLERIATTGERIAQVVQLLGGAALIVMLDAYLTIQTRAHVLALPDWLPNWSPLAIPAVLTPLWLYAASLNVRQLWQEWREGRQRRQAGMETAISVSSDPHQRSPQPQPWPQDQRELWKPPPAPQPPTSPQPPTAQP